MRLQVRLPSSAEAVGAGRQPAAALLFSFSFFGFVFNTPSTIYSVPTAGQLAMTRSPWGHERTPAVPGEHQLGACPEDGGSTGGGISAGGPSEE